MLETIQQRFLEKCLRRSASKKSLLYYLQETGDGTNCIYIYPNQNTKVFVKNKAQETVDTKHKLPSWVMNNVIKLFEEKSQKAGAARGYEDKESSIRDVKKEVVNLRKDIKHIKKDIQVIMEYVKFAKK